MAAAEGKERPAWVTTQRKVFCKFMNSHLVKKGFEPLPIDTVHEAFDAGGKLMELLFVLFEVPIKKYNKAPKQRMHRVDNLAIAFKSLEESGVKTNFLKSTHLLDHDEKMILGMLWSFILEYAIKGISVDELTAKEGLLLWVQKKTKGYRDVDPPKVKNFHSSWKDGMAFCALIHRHRPDLIDYDSLDKANAADNLELAFSVAEKELDIPRLLDVEDLTESVRPDERSVMTYVSEFFHKFASQDIQEQAARRVQKYLEFMRALELRQAEYERRARALIEWCGETGKRFGEANFGETLEDAKEAYAAFRGFVTGEKPPQAGEKLDVQALYAEIQTERVVNRRPAYEPPQGLSPDEIDGAWAELGTAEATYSAAVRKNRFRFIERKEAEIDPEKLEEINAAFTHFDKNDSDTLDKVEFKAALSALGVPFKDEENLARVFAEVSEGNEFISRAQYVKYNMALAEDKDSPEQLVASFTMLAGNNGSITEEQLNCPPLTDEDRAWLVANLPKKDDGTFDYSAFVDSAFVKE